LTFWPGWLFRPRPMKRKSLTGCRRSVRNKTSRLPPHPNPQRMRVSPPISSRSLNHRSRRILTFRPRFPCKGKGRGKVTHPRKNLCPGCPALQGNLRTTNCATGSHKPLNLPVDPLHLTGMKRNPARWVISLHVLRRTLIQGRANLPRLKPQRT
jgi:hypothetical protein